MGMRCELRKSKRDYADMQDLRNYTRVRRDIDVDFEGQLELLERIRLWIRGMTCSTAHPSPTPGNQLATLDVSDSLQAESKHVQMRKRILQLQVALCSAQAYCSLSVDASVHVTPASTLTLALTC